jgi:hypothetical protein
MNTMKTATSRTHHPFRVEARPDGSFRIYHLIAHPLPITRRAAEAWLEWMDNDGVEELRKLIRVGRL